jgi:hypothetical protein
MVFAVASITARAVPLPVAPVTSGLRIAWYVKGVASTGDEEVTVKTARATMATDRAKIFINALRF